MQNLPPHGLMRRHEKEPATSTEGSCRNRSNFSYHVAGTIAYSAGYLLALCRICPHISRFLPLRCPKELDFGLHSTLFHGLAPPKTSQQPINSLLVLYGRYCYPPDVPNLIFSRHQVAARALRNLAGGALWVNFSILLVMSSQHNDA